jgi:hypothetical protein
VTEEEELRFERAAGDDRGAYNTAWDEFRQQTRNDPRIRDVVEYGFAAMEQLTPRQRYYAMEQLFRDHFECVHRREAEERLARDVEAEHTYLQADDVHWVQDAFGDTDPSDDDAILTGVLAGPLHRVLQELELLQFRTSIQGKQTGASE